MEHEKHKNNNKNENHEHNMIADFRRRFWISLGLSVPILALAPMIQEFLNLSEQLSFTGDRYIQAALATIIFFYGGWPFLKGLVKELKKKSPGMMTLIGMAISVAYLYSTAVVFGVQGKTFYWELATLIDVMLLGHWIEMRAVGKASGALEKLAAMMPKEAHRIDENGDTTDVSVDDLSEGDTVLIKPGEKVPLDGQITEGRTTINQAMITGESRPVEKNEGDEVIGGTINGDSSIKVKISKTSGQSYMSQMIDLVKKAQQSRSKTQNLADRAALALTIIAISVAAITLVVWLIFKPDFQFALERAVTVMVITCPHALGLAVPLVVAVTTSLAAANGLLIRNRTGFETIRKIDAVVFDKTGTLTEGKFGVDEIIAAEGTEENKVLELAAAVETNSEHPIAHGIVEHAKEKDLQIPQPKDFNAIAGRGAKAKVDNAEIKVVSPNYLKEENIEIDKENFSKLEGSGKTVVYVLRDDKLIGAVALSDIVRDVSKQAVSALKEMNIKVMMITGDDSAVAEAVAKTLDLDDYFAEVLPDKKADKIKEIQQQGLKVAMVGDGINDAPALAQADVGIAIGAGTDIAIESADIVLVESDPRSVKDVIRLSNRSHSKMVQNLWWAAGYNIVAIPLAAGVLAWAGILMPPAIGALVMSVSTVIVAFNAKLLSFNN